jgi:hypothetical protein
MDSYRQWLEENRSSKTGLVAPNRDHHFKFTGLLADRAELQSFWAATAEGLALQLLSQQQWKKYQRGDNTDRIPWKRSATAAWQRMTEPTDSGRRAPTTLAELGAEDSEPVDLTSFVKAVHSMPPLTSMDKTLAIVSGQHSTFRGPHPKQGLDRMSRVADMGYGPSAHRPQIGS